MQTRIYRPIGVHRKMEKMSKKDLILKESYKPFLSKGYDAVSLADIERHAKVTRGGYSTILIAKRTYSSKLPRDLFFRFLKMKKKNTSNFESAMSLKGFISNRLHIIKKRMKYFYREVDNCIIPVSFTAFILYLKDHYDDWSKRIDRYEKHKLQLWEENNQLSKKEARNQRRFRHKAISFDLPQLVFRIILSRSSN